MTDDINTPQQPDEPDAPAPLTVEQIVVGLTAERTDLARLIGVDQMQRAQANERIRSNRARLVDVDRLLNAAKPRTRKETAS